MTATTTDLTSHAVSATETARVHTGKIDGAEYRIEVPVRWNGVALFYSHHYRMPGLPCPALVVPSDDEFGPRVDAAAIRQILLDRGYALAGTAKTTGWMLEDTLRDQVALHDWFLANIGSPTHSYVWGLSPGGLASITLAQNHPRRFDGALSLGADASGVINQMNLRLDAAHAINTLLVQEHDLDLGLISDPNGNVDKAVKAVNAAAQADALTRARLILACALGNLVPSVDAHAPHGVTDPDAAVAHLAWIVTYSHASVIFGPARKNIEERAGGNPLWNTGVDYVDLFTRSAMRELAERAYRQAGASLIDDLNAVNAAPRVAADQHAIEYFIRTGGCPGLTPVPVVTVHAIRDGAAPVEHERALADRVALLGDPGNLRQLYLDRNFTSSMSPAEIITALGVLEQRVETGEWQDTGAANLNRIAGAHPEAHRRVYNFWIPLEREGERYAPLPPAFVDYQPAPLPRTWPF